MSEPGAPEASAPEEPVSETRQPPGLRSRLERGRQTFQPGLWLRLVGIGVVAIYTLLFVVLNTRKVRIDFAFVSTRASLIWVILLCLGVGLVLGVLLSQLHRHRMRSR